MIVMSAGPCIYTAIASTSIADRKAMKVLTDGGVQLEPISPTRIVEIEPALSGAKDGLAGAIYCPTDELGDCHKFTNALADALALDRRVTFHWGTPIERIATNGGRVTQVETARGPSRPMPTWLRSGVTRRS